jgi:hypothetical protein
MGWDISTLGKHDLDLKDVETVAKQISQRLELNIEYGYFQYYKYSSKNNLICYADNKWIRLGRICPYKNKPIYRLDDDRYFEKEVRSFIGDSGLIPTYEEGDPFEFSDGQYRYSLIIPRKKPEDIKFLTIYDEAFKFGLWDEPWEVLREYRLRQKRICRALGCPYLYLFSDQGPSELIDNVDNENWMEIESYIKSLDWIDECHEIDRKYYHIKKQISKENAARDRSLFQLISIPEYLTTDHPGSKWCNDVFVDDFSDLDGIEESVT